MQLAHTRSIDWKPTLTRCKQRGSAASKTRVGMGATRVFVSIPSFLRGPELGFRSARWLHDSAALKCLKLEMSFAPQLSSLLSKPILALEHVELHFHWYQRQRYHPSSIRLLRPTVGCLEPSCPQLSSAFPIIATVQLGKLLRRFSRFSTQGYERYCGTEEHIQLQ